MDFVIVVLKEINGIPFVKANPFMFGFMNKSYGVGDESRCLFEVTKIFKSSKTCKDVELKIYGLIWIKPIFQKAKIKQVKNWHHTLHRIKSMNDKYPLFIDFFAFWRQTDTI